MDQRQRTDCRALLEVINRLDQIFVMTQRSELFASCTGEGIDVVEASVVRARTAANNELVRLGDHSLSPIEGKIVSEERAKAISAALGLESLPARA